MNINESYAGRVIKMAGSGEQEMFGLTEYGLQEGHCWATSTCSDVNTVRDVFQRAKSLKLRVLY